MGASRCVPVCSPGEMLFQYQAGPRASELLISVSENRQVCPNCGGRPRIGVSEDNGAVRSTTSTAPVERAATRSASTGTRANLARGGRKKNWSPGRPARGPGSSTTLLLQETTYLYVMLTVEAPAKDEVALSTFGRTGSVVGSSRPVTLRMSSVQLPSVSTGTVPIEWPAAEPFT